MGQPLGQELAKPRIPQTAGRFFNGLGGFVGTRVRCGLGGGVDVRRVERDVEALREIAAEGKVLVGFGAAQTVMKMHGEEDKAQFPSLTVKGAEKRD